MLACHAGVRRAMPVGVLCPGRGHEHLGNTRQVHERHYLDREKDSAQVVRPEPPGKYQLIVCTMWNPAAVAPRGRSAPASRRTESRRSNNLKLPRVDGNLIYEMAI